MPSRKTPRNWDESRYKDREKRIQYERKYYLKKRYGLSLDDYNEMFEAQGGVCAICGGTQEGMLYVDHCHTSSRVRGLLCHLCNVGLGAFKDSEESLTNALTYLRGE